MLILLNIVFFVVVRAHWYLDIRGTGWLVWFAQFESLFEFLRERVSTTMPHPISCLLRVLLDPVSRAAQINDSLHLLLLIHQLIQNA